MKQILNRISFGICLLLTIPLHAQVVLNEIYADPGAGNQEFFEFFNINTSNTPASVDDYTIISYFEEGSKKGFFTRVVWFFWGFPTVKLFGDRAYGGG